MKLKNVLIVVEDIEKSIAFYQDLFGLSVILDNDGNVIMTEGLVLQDKKYGINSLKGKLFQKIMPASCILKSGILRRLQRNWTITIDRLPM